jgi:hypothetical protein
MQPPVEITFRGMPPSPGLEMMVRDWTRTLVQVLPIQRCSAVIETDRGRDNAPYRIHLLLAIPGHTLSLSHGATEQYRDPYLAVAHAFRAARNELFDRVSERQLRHAV